MGKRTTRKSERDRERDHALAMKRLDAVVTVFRPFMLMCGVAFILFCGVALPVIYSAGKETTISFILDWVQSIHLGEIAAYGAACGGCGWGWLERRKRLREREERDQRIIALERSLDPQRTSSGLLTDGSEPPKEQDP